ncbi:CheR family methyltransferase [Pirellulaceae bacterium SH449]
MTALQDRSLTSKEYQTVKSLIYQFAGIALTDYKQVMVQGRLNKRMRKLEIDSYRAYLDYLQDPSNTEEVTHFINVMTTNKTDFFREPHHFEYLARTAFPEVVKRAEKTGEKRLRIWCSASSTGEEPYTIAMAVREYFGAAHGWDIKILASDIDTEVLSAAEEGTYQPERVSELPSELLKRYFERPTQLTDGNFVVKSALRDLLTFRKINLHDSKWPIHTAFDMIFCRNVMIYFDSAAQSKIINHFGDYLKQDGLLFIGHSESIFGLSDQFALMGDTIYKKTSATSSSITTRLPPIRTQTPRSPVDQVECGDHPKISRSLAPLDKSSRDPVHAIIIGEVYVSESPVWISTLLGSCVSVCLYDEMKGIGGMNHFMLPAPRDESVVCQRFGVHAIELLINSLMKRGADRRRLCAKVFGGCNALRNSFSSIAQENIRFAHEFLQTEGIPVKSSYTSQGMGMSVQFHTKSFRALVRVLDRNESIAVESETNRLAPVVLQSMAASESITIFQEI